MDQELLVANISNLQKKSFRKTSLNMLTKTTVMEKSVLLPAYKFLVTLSILLISILHKYINLGFKPQILEQNSPTSCL